METDAVKETECLMGWRGVPHSTAPGSMSALISHRVHSTMWRSEAVEHHGTGWDRQGPRASDPEQAELGPGAADYFLGMVRGSVPRPYNRETDFSTLDVFLSSPLLSFSFLPLLSIVFGYRKVLKEISVGELNPNETVQANVEAQLLSRLHHPAIVRFHASFMEQETFCIITEYCEVRLSSLKICCMIKNLYKETS